MYRIDESLLPAGTTDLSLENQSNNGIPGEICVLMELSACNGKYHDEAYEDRLQLFLEELQRNEIVIDCMYDYSSNLVDLWNIREQLPVCLMQQSRTTVDMVDSSHSNAIATR